MAQELPITSLKVTVRGHHVRKVPSHFQDVCLDVRIEGGLSEEQVKTLAHEASGLCFVENTLAQGIPVITEVHLGGRRLLTLRRGPDAA